MKFKKKLIHGKLVKRYKRFLADVELDDGKIVTAHCTNSGAMTSCLEDGAEVYLTPVDEPKRKTKFTWEMIKINGDWVGINTGNPNILAYEAIKKGEIEHLSGYTEVKREVKWGDSRFDVWAKNANEECFIEVKNVTMKVGDRALFPDAKTTRGLKHLETLIKAKESGFRAVMLYIIQRSDVSTFSTAANIDPEYDAGLRKAMQNGVEVIAMQAQVDPVKIEFVKVLEVVI